MSRILIRPASPSDEAAIHRLTKNEHVRPEKWRWRNFVIAERDRVAVGLAQMRTHFDGSREIGTVVVEQRSRKLGIGGQMLEALLRRAPDEAIFIITGRAYAGHYAQWSFRPVRLIDAPFAIGWYYLLGQGFGWVMSRWRHRPRNHLAILGRFPNEVSGEKARDRGNNCDTARSMEGVL